MLKSMQILVSAALLAASGATLSGCGQRGPLFLPTEQAAAQRATLPETLTPGTATPPASVSDEKPTK